MDIEDPYDWDAEEARLLGLTEEEAGWLKTARLACDRLNESLERNNSTRRWAVLGSGDPRRKRK